MATKKKDVAPDTEVEAVESDETTDEAPASPKRPITKNSLTVTLPNGTARTYSEFTHGKNWEIMANNYATSQGGEIE